MKLPLENRQENPDSDEYAEVSPQADFIDNADGADIASVSDLTSSSEQEEEELNVEETTAEEITPEEDSPSAGQSTVASEGEQDTDEEKPGSS